MPSTPLQLHLGAGVLIGFGLSACSFNLVLAAFGKLLPERWRPLAFGAGTAAGSFGQFLFPPIGNILIDTLGWHQALVVFAFTLLPVLPISIFLSTRKLGGQTAKAAAANLPNQTIVQALSEAFRHRSLTSSSCSVSSPAASSSPSSPCICRPISRMPACRPGSAAGRWPSSARQCRGLALRRLALDADAEALSPRLDLPGPGRGDRAVFIMIPASPTTCIAFGIAIGLLWLSTVPANFVAGHADVRHEIHGDALWLRLLLASGWRLPRRLPWRRALLRRWAATSSSGGSPVALGVISALINLPIVERPVERPAAQPA